MLSILLYILFFLPNEGQLDSMISNYLQTKLDSYSKWNYEIISKPNVLNNEKIKLQIDYSKEFKLNGQYAYIPVKIQINENQFSYSLLTLKLELFDTVLIAMRDIKYNDTISINDTEIKIENVTNLKGKILDTKKWLNDLSNKSELSELRSLRLIKAKRKINIGEILYENMFTELPLINKGDKLQAHFIYGKITISFDVEAREDGFSGNQIRVIDTNNKIYTALVLNKNNVKIIKP